jgi:2-pyrone-4,6-dicarboxylate lactonase
MAERIKPLGWHLVLHLDAEDLLTYREFLLGLPVPFAIDHMGRTMVKNGLEQPRSRCCWTCCAPTRRPG